jgi:hypothetical protein
MRYASNYPGDKLKQPILIGQKQELLILKDIHNEKLASVKKKS